MKKPRFLFVSTVVAVCLAVASEPVPGEEFRVGKVPVEIPAPDGMVRLDGINEGFDKADMRKPPEGGKTVAIFGTPEDLAELKAGKIPRVDTECIVYAMYPEAVVKAGDFAQVREGTAKAQRGMVKQFKEKAAAAAPFSATTFFGSFSWLP